MGKCKTCGIGTWWWNDVECKECEKKRIDKWIKEHTFTFQEKVNILPDNFHIEPRIGIVIDKGEDVNGYMGYYSAAEWYKVKLEFTDEIVKFSPEQLQKIER